MCGLPAPRPGRSLSAMMMRWMNMALACAVVALVARIGLGQSTPAVPPEPVRSPLATSLSDGGRASLEKHLDDWAQLGRYTKDNATLALPAAGEQRVVFYGDSITDHWGRGAEGGSFFPDKPYVNRGISGQTTEQMVVRFQQDVCRTEARGRRHPGGHKRHCRQHRPDDASCDRGQFSQHGADRTGERHSRGAGECGCR